MDDFYIAYGLLDLALEYGFTMACYTLRPQFDELKDEEAFKELVEILEQKVRI